MNLKIRIFSFLFISLLLIIQSCKKDVNDSDQRTPQELINKEINNWINDSLKRYYYWAEELTNVDTYQDPVVFFNKKKNIKDRFSIIYNPLKQETIPSNIRTKFGFDYAFIQFPNNNKTIGIIKWVEPDSPAGRAGLKRGDYFNKINNIEISESNVLVIKNNMLEANSFVMSLININDGGEILASKNINLNMGVVYETNFLSNVFKSNNKSIGYLYFNQFSNINKSLFIDVFGNFKSNGITDLILDLRYNAGGEVSCAAALGALIIKNIKSDNAFIVYQGNKNGGRRTETFVQSSSYNGGPIFSSYINNNVALDKIYILTSASTASAAEIVINNLKPYINVVQIGEKTRGKDEASIVIKDSRKPKKVDYIMLPIVYKVFNKLNVGNYENGIQPDYTISEFSKLPLKNISDTSETLLAYAVNLIIGNNLNTKISDSKINNHSNLPSVKVLYDSSSEEGMNDQIIAHQ